MNKTKLDLYNEMEQIEKIAIDKYTDGIGITDMLIETMDDEELLQYNELHLEYYEACFYCGTIFNCKYCRDFQDEGEQTNE